MSIRQVKVIAGEDRLGKVSNDLIVKDCTFVVDTSAYASGDLISDVVEISGVFRSVDAPVELISVDLLDKADQKAVLWMVFQDIATSLGTINGAPNISDANLLTSFIGHVPIIAADYVDYGGASVASLRNVGLPLIGGGVSTSLWAGIINSTGTPTYGAAGDLVARLTFRRH